LIRDAASMLGGEPPAARLIAAAETGGDDKTRLYAYYYGGVRALTQGQNDEAERLLRQAVDLGLVTQLEHDLATCRLRELVEPSR